MPSQGDSPFGVAKEYNVEGVMIVVVALMIMDLRLHAHSLKEKRSIVKSVLSRMHRYHNLSVYEAGHHDVHTRTRLAASWVGPDPDSAARVLESIIAIAEGAGAELVDTDLQIL